MRLASGAVARRLTTALLACCCISIGCGGPASDTVSAAWSIDPAPPATGVATVARITLKDKNQQALRGAKLRLEGHMSHPGMAPVTSAITERGEGVYDARLQFSMAGDWTLVLTGELSDGTRITKQLGVSGVRDTSPAAPGQP